MAERPAYLWDEIRRNRRRSWVLIFLTSLLLTVTGATFGAAYGGQGGAIAGLAISFVVATLLGLVSYYGGGSLMLAASSARKIEKRDHPQLFNVVEEMSIASGLPMPAVYIIDDTAPNAFATGRDPQHASVAITTGLLEKLDRDELQGVMAHEMSHVRNYDILYATMVAVMVGSIALLCDIFLRMTFLGGGRRRSSDREGGGGGAAVLIMVLAIVLAILAPIFAKLLQMAVSRRREYLADASAAQLTRYPEGLARALEKISGDQEVLEVANRATMHLYIVNPIKSFEERAAGLFSTHPPTDERVRILREMGHNFGPRAGKQ